ncbi:cytochrome P450 [Mycobacterium seoulense]|uniref:cytochrome P450 n=1 Tax=Mycobacterium seoulense TaxID=386911 RepID=UPI003CFA67EB
MVHFNAMTDMSAEPWEALAKDRHQCPVERVEVGGFVYHQVSEPKLIRQLLRRHDIFSNEMGVLPRGPEPVGERVLEFADPPAHRTHRQLVAKAFSNAQMNERISHIQAVADDLVDAIAAQGNTFELRRQFGRPLPSTIVAEILGVPVQDRDLFMDLTERVEALLAEEQTSQETTHVMQQFIDYIYEQFRIRETVPTDDLLSSILYAEVDGKRFTRLEAAAMVRLLLGAGNGTTSIAISNTVWLIETNPAEKAKLLTDLDGLVESTVEEGLRFDCPVGGNFRGVTQSTELGGVNLKAGDRVFANYLAANHDPDRYDDPDSFKVDRPWAELPPHFAFGHGIHYCIGAPLARAETAIGLKTLYRRLPRLRLADGFTPERVPGAMFRTWTTVQLQFDGPVGPRLSDG